jgi:transcriptional regulator with XRE-family HTH domain
MVIGERIRAIREGKGLSQGDVEGRSGMLRCYISRVENGHTVPSIETLEKFARALDVPLHQFFYEGETAPALSALSAEEVALQQEKRSTLGRFAELFQKLTTQDKQILIKTAERLSKI